MLLVTQELLGALASELEKLQPGSGAKAAFESPKAAAHGDLVRFDCLTLSSEASQTRGWAFTVDGQVEYLRPGGPVDCSDGQVLHDWCLRGLGLAWRSTWEVEADIAAGRLVEVLAHFAAPPNGIYAMLPQRKHLPLRLRLWVDHLRRHFAHPDFPRRAPA